MHDPPVRALPRASGSRSRRRAWPRTKGRALGALAGEGHEHVLAAPGAAHAGEAVVENPAIEKARDDALHAAAPEAKARLEPLLPLRLDALVTRLEEPIERREPRLARPINGRSLIGRARTGDVHVAALKRRRCSRANRIDRRRRRAGSANRASRSTPRPVARVAAGTDGCCQTSLPNTRRRQICCRARGAWSHRIRRTFTEPSDHGGRSVTRPHPRRSVTLQRRGVQR